MICAREQLHACPSCILLPRRITLGDVRPWDQTSFQTRQQRTVSMLLTTWRGSAQHTEERVGRVSDSGHCIWNREWATNIRDIYSCLFTVTWTKYALYTTRNLLTRCDQSGTSWAFDSDHRRLKYKRLEFEFKAKSTWKWLQVLYCFGDQIKTEILHL